MIDKRHLVILQLILDSKIPVGATYLCKESGISQATVGRILFDLEQQGYLTKAGNKGRLLTDSGRDYIALQKQFLDKLDTAQDIIDIVGTPSRTKLLEILETRIGLESVAVTLACKNITEQNIAELNSILAAHSVELRSGGLGSEYDLKLHLKIAEIAGNHVLMQVLKLILTQDNAYTNFSIVAPHITDTQIHQHTKIVEMLHKRDAEGAKAAMVEHLQQVMYDVRCYYDTHEKN